MLPSKPPHALVDFRCLGQRLRHEADSKHGLFGLVQEFQVPFGVLLQAARNAADKIAANRGHFGPGCLAALEFRALVGSAGIATVADPEEIQRHVEPIFLGPPPSTACRRPTSWMMRRYQVMNLPPRMITAWRCGTRCR